MESMTNVDRIVLRVILYTTSVDERERTKGLLSGRERYIKNDFDKEVKSILDLDKKKQKTPIK